MDTLEYQDYCDYYASKCKICTGKKRVLHNSIWTCCPCQQHATLKYRFEKIQTYPQELKYSKWSDFTGEIKTKNKQTGKLEIGGHLSAPVFINAKKKAMEYCFSSSDPSVVDDRRNTLVLHKNNGRNVVIVGKKNTGKTLLAALILKEVAHASYLFKKLNIDFKWLKASDLINASRWDNDKSVDHEFLNSLNNIQFIVIDDIDMYRTGHNTPPDTVSLDVLFSYRKLASYPTIVICTPEFFKTASKYEIWGREFTDLITRSDNVLIELY